MWDDLPWDNTDHSPLSGFWLNGVGKHIGWEQMRQNALAEEKERKKERKKKILKKPT